MEIPGIPELNQSTLDEKADSARQKRALSLPAVKPRLNFQDLGLALFLLLLAVGIVTFLIDHVFKGNRGAEVPVQSLPSHLVSK